MTTPNNTPATPTTPNATRRVGGRIVPADRFPRKGAFCVVSGMLAIVAAIGKRETQAVEEDDPRNPGTMRTVQRDVIITDAPFAEVHLVATDRADVADDGRLGDFKPAPRNFPVGNVTAAGEIRNVPFDHIERAAWSDVATILDERNGGDPRPPNAYGLAAGYVLTDAEIADVPPLERRKLGYPLSPEESAIADATELEEQQKAADAHYVANHPDAADVEAEIERQRLEFVAKVEQIRAAAAAAILKTRDK